MAIAKLSLGVHSLVPLQEVLAYATISLCVLDFNFNLLALLFSSLRPFVSFRLLFYFLSFFHEQTLLRKYNAHIMCTHEDIRCSTR